MGAPKQKWTAEEEAALRAGVEKYGPGKWRAIQKDPKFGPCLTSRSNVDLKDKWRNMSVSANGSGSSRERKSLALSSGTGMMTLMEEAVAVTPLASSSPEGDSDKPLLLTGPGSKSADRKSLGSRYDDIVVEAVLGLKDAKGSSNASIASYIEERHPVPTNFRRLLTSKLKALTFQGKLVKVKQDYKVPPGVANDSPPEVAKPVKNTRPRRPEAPAAPPVPEEIRRTPRFPRDPAKKLRGDRERDRDRDVNAKKAKAVDTEVARTKMKTAEEAARAAVQAVAEAEAAAAAAEQAAREAELAEAEAEAAEAAAQAAAAAARPHKRVRAMAMARAEEVSVKA